MTWIKIVVFVIAAFISANYVETARSKEIKYKGSLPDISILIVAGTDLNFAYLRNTIKSLYDALDELDEEEKIEEEIIIVEQGSLDTTAKKFQRKDGILNAIEHHKKTGRRIKTVDIRQGSKLSTALNASVAQASSNLLLILSDKTEVLPNFFKEIRSYLKNGEVALREDLGVLGPKLIRSDRTIFHAGMEFSMAKMPSKGSPTNSNWWNKNKGGENKGGESIKQNTALPYFLHIGRDSKDKRVNSEAEVRAVSYAAMLLNRDIFNDVGGFNESFSDTFTYVDFCLKIKKLGKKILYVPTVEAMYFGGEDKWEVEDEVKYFHNVWGSTLEKEIKDNYLIKNLTLVWNMECGRGQVLGFTTEALGFIAGLENKIPLKIEVANIQTCVDDMLFIGLPVCLVNSLRRLSEISVEKYSVLVVHKDPGRYASFVDANNENIAYVIGRSMYETDRIPSNWVNNANNLVDKIWVPSQFNVKTFSENSVKLDKLEVVPEPVDVYTYDPDVVSPLDLPDIKGFNFLSIMKWEARKGWDILLRAYFEEFTAEDDVSLFIRSNMENRNVDEFKVLIDKFVKEKNKTEDDLPQVVLLKDPVPYTKLPSLYKAVDCVVLATHGEGWGLPIAEGMSMELPTIATNWSGNTEFMTPENSYLIEVEEMVEAATAGHFWAKPSKNHLKVLMRTVFENRNEASLLGKKARSDLRNRFSVERLADLVIGKLQVIEPQVDKLISEKKAKKNAPKDQKKETEKDDKKKGGKNQIKIVEDA